MWDISQHPSVLAGKGRKKTSLQTGVLLQQVLSFSQAPERGWVVQEDILAGISLPKSGILFMGFYKIIYLFAFLFLFGPAGHLTLTARETLCCPRECELG